MDVRRSGRGSGTKGAAILATAVAIAGTLSFATATPSHAAECRPGQPLCSLFSAPTTQDQAAPAATVPTTPPVTVAPAPATAAPAPVARSVPEAAQRLLDLVNGERAKAGLGRLTSREDVVVVALAHSHRMAAAGDIFHNDSYFSDETQKLLNSQARGENVAHNSSVGDTHTRLMNSPGHRANILDPRFSIAGFAVVKAADGRYFTTQDFVQPSGAVAAADRVAAPPLPAAPTAPRTAVAAAAPAAVDNAAPQPVRAPVVEPITATAARHGEQGEVLLRRLPGPGATPNPPAGRVGSPRQAGGTWLATAVLLALVALAVHLTRRSDWSMAAPR